MSEPAPAAPAAPAHPYQGIAAYRHWMRAGGIGRGATLDPVVAPKFTFTRADGVATAGSCFAQNVTRHLAGRGFNVVVSEAVPRVVPLRERRGFGYGVYSTLSGNIYTARQLRQWLERAYGRFEPNLTVWRRGEALVDPFRPQVAGFACERELALAREAHLAAVRAMVREMSLFVFTLGLTEAWVDRQDGAVLPVAPGVAGGSYEPERHALVSFTADEVAADLVAALALIAEHNPAAKIVLTVSPVPLMATGLDRHVLVSTVHSKAELLVAAHRVAAADPRVDYFPSYEIVTAPHTRGAYFGRDCRSVTEAGVRHVMRVFLKHYAGEATEPRQARLPLPQLARLPRLPRLPRRDRLAEVLCDEEMLRRTD